MLLQQSPGKAVSHARETEVCMWRAVPRQTGRLGGGDWLPAEYDCIPAFLHLEKFLAERMPSVITCFAVSGTGILLFAARKVAGLVADQSSCHRAEADLLPSVITGFAVSGTVIL